MVLGISWIVCIQSHKVWWGSYSQASFRSKLRLNKRTISVVIGIAVKDILSGYTIWKVMVSFVRSVFLISTPQLRLRRKHEASTSWVSYSCCNSGHGLATTMLGLLIYLSQSNLHVYYKTRRAHLNARIIHRRYIQHTDHCLPVWPSQKVHRDWSQCSQTKRNQLPTDVHWRVTNNKFGHAPLQGDDTVADVGSIGGDETIAWVCLVRVFVIYCQPPYPTTHQRDRCKSC